MNVKSRRPTTSLLNFKLDSNKNSKKKAQEFHFKQRFYERVGYHISDKEYENLRNSIQTIGKYIHPGESGSVFLINYRGINLKVVFNIITQTLITVLP